MQSMTCSDCCDPALAVRAACESPASGSMHALDSVRCMGGAWRMHALCCACVVDIPGSKGTSMKTNAWPCTQSFNGMQVDTPSARSNAAPDSSHQQRDVHACCPRRGRARAWTEAAGPCKNLDSDERRGDAYQEACQPCGTESMQQRTEGSQQPSSSLPRSCYRCRQL